MRRQIGLVAFAVALLAPGAAGAQTTTVDGVQALFREDYETAARILRPLAEATSPPDPVAQFFLAMLYASGRGGGNSFQACAMYLASATTANPLATQSLALMRATLDQIGRTAQPCAGRTSTDDHPVRSTPAAPGPVAPTIVRARTGTDDGVEAFVRGDYQRAAEILKPIVAEQPPWSDFAARFLMGALYENGLGVAADEMRACGLYTLSVGPSRNTPVTVAASALVHGMIKSMPPEVFEDCQLLASIGLDHGFQPVTFELEPGDWISWDLRGATISYRGKQTRIRRPLASAYGTVFLPLQHTELAVGPSRSARRHFIEAFTWRPTRDRSSWTLTWQLFEVVRAELISIASDDPVTISAQAPPRSLPFDGHEVAQVRVNDAGEAEWAVLVGPHQRSGAIESDAERQEVKQLKLARAAADAQVDLKLERDVRRPPALKYGDSDGCGSVFVYGWSDDHAEAIAVRADKNLLQLSTTAQSFDIATSQTGLEVVVHVYERSMLRWPFCTDVIILPGMPEETWRATRGTVTIEQSAPGVRALTPYLYRVTIRIAGAEFVNSSGVRVKQSQPIVLTAIVGGVIG